MNETSALLNFSSKKELFVGEKLALVYAYTWPDYHRWLSRAPERITAEQGRAKLQEYMPELLTTYDSLCHALGGDEQTRAFLSLYNPPTFRSGCSQACKITGELELVRNYDFPAKLCDRLLLHTNWNGTKVMAMTDCLWGVLDGINEYGLAVSLAYGGRFKHGDGFAITLVLRYILEFCHTTEQAIEKLRSVPIHMAYNITLLDRQGISKTVVICPGEEIQVSSLTFATNHQSGAIVENIDVIADSYTREQYIATRLADPRQQNSSLVSLFLEPPLLRKASDWQDWGTLYTARYLPLSGSVELHWPNGQILRNSFENFVEASISISSPAYL